MTVSIVMVAVITGAFLVAVRCLVPERAYLFQGMFGYDADLGWPRGVQEEDGERAWVAHEKPAWDLEEDELAWAAAIGTSTIVELEAEHAPARVPIVRVKADVSMARLPSEGAGVTRRTPVGKPTALPSEGARLPSEGAAVARPLTRRTTPRRREA